MTFIIALVVSAIILVGGLYCRILFRLWKALQNTGSNVDVLIEKTFSICQSQNSAAEKQKWLLAMVKSGRAEDYYYALEVAKSQLKMRVRRTKNPFEIGSLIQAQICLSELQYKLCDFMDD